MELALHYLIDQARHLAPDDYMDGLFEKRHPRWEMAAAAAAVQCNAKKSALAGAAGAARHVGLKPVALCTRGALAVVNRTSCLRPLARSPWSPGAAPDSQSRHKEPPALPPVRAQS